MFNFLSKDSIAHKISQLVIDKLFHKLSDVLESKFKENDKKLNTVIAHLESLRIELSSLDQRLTSKELKDKTEYGQMTYKIKSLQNDLRNNSSD